MQPAPTAVVAPGPAFLAGFVAGEGCFTVVRQPTTFADGSTRLRFCFAVEVAARDRPLLEALRAQLGVGAISERQVPKERRLRVARLDVHSHRAHRERTIPFFRRWLVATRKRVQLEGWVAALDAYEAEHPNRWGRGPSTCSIDGCGRPVRGRGLCRTPYRQATGW